MTVILKNHTAKHTEPEILKALIVFEDVAFIDMIKYYLKKRMHASHPDHLPKLLYSTTSYFVKVEIVLMERCYTK